MSVTDVRTDVQELFEEDAAHAQRGKWDDCYIRSGAGVMARRMALWKWPGTREV